MVSFDSLLQASQEDLIKIFYVFHDLKIRTGKKAATIAVKLGLNNGQLICAVGFNPHARESTETVSILGFERFTEIEELRNEYFTKDIYRRLSLDNIVAIYECIKDDPDMLHTMQYLLRRRLASIEDHIENTVSSATIEKYKSEIRAIYADGIATIEFAQERLTQVNSGFRALLNEVSIITESRLIPVGEIFFMDTILPEEKRRLLARELIPVELVEMRLQNPNLVPAEKKLLREYLQQQGQQN